MSRLLAAVLVLIFPFLAAATCYDWPLRTVDGRAAYDGDTVYVTMPGLPPELAQMSVRALGIEPSTIARASEIRRSPPVAAHCIPTSKELASAVSRRGSGKPIPKNPTRDAILARLRSQADVEAHPDQKNAAGTKYISAFICRNGSAFAIDKMSASKQPIWFLDNPRMRSTLDAAGIAYDFYPPEKGRNSNLHKIPGFKKGALLRAYPETADDAALIISALRNRI